MGSSTPPLAAAILTNLETKLENAGVDPRIPWLGKPTLTVHISLILSPKCILGLGERLLRVLSVEEYLTLERESEERHEYLDGYVYAMAGESPEHRDICSNC